MSRRSLSAASSSASATRAAHSSPRPAEASSSASNTAPANHRSPLLSSSSASSSSSSSFSSADELLNSRSNTALRASAYYGVQPAAVYGDVCDAAEDFVNDSCTQLHAELLQAFKRTKRHAAKLKSSSSSSTSAPSSSARRKSGVSASSSSSSVSAATQLVSALNESDIEAVTESAMESWVDTVLNDSEKAGQHWQRRTLAQVFDIPPSLRVNPAIHPLTSSSAHSASDSSVSSSIPIFVLGHPTDDESAEQFHSLQSSQQTEEHKLDEQILALQAEVSADEAIISRLSKASALLSAQLHQLEAALPPSLSSYLEEEKLPWQIQKMKLLCKEAKEIEDRAAEMESLIEDDEQFKESLEAADTDTDQGTGAHGAAAASGSNSGFTVSSSSAFQSAESTTSTDVQYLADTSRIALANGQSEEEENI